MTATNIDPQRGGTAFALALRCVMQVARALAVLMQPPRIHWHQAWPASPQKLAIATAAFGVLFLFGMIFVDAAMVETLLQLPRWIVAFFQAITDFGKSGWFLWPLGILFLVLASLSPRVSLFSQLVLATIMVRVGFLFMAIGVPSLLVSLLKNMIGRARPLVTGHADPFAFSPFIWRAAYASLPSGHTTTAFAVLIALGAFWPRGRTLLLVYAVLIAASRVIITAHYPTDVFAGAVIGVLGALMVRRWFALRRLGFSIQPDGRIYQYAGPSLKRIKAVAHELLAE